MARWSVLMVGLMLLGCQNPAYPTSDYSDPGVPAGGPPYTATYRNTTPGTTGTVPNDPNTYPDGATVTVLGNSGHLSWPGWTFDGWNTKNNGGANGGGGGTFYAPGAAFLIHSNVVLYGTWH